MAGSALDRLFNTVEDQKRPAPQLSVEEQLLEVDGDDGMFLDGMSEESKRALYDRVKPTPEKVELVEEEDESKEVEKSTAVAAETLEEDETQVNDDNDELERPAERPVNAEDIPTDEETEDDVVEALIQPAKTRRSRKPRQKESTMEGTTNTQGEVQSMGIYDSMIKTLAETMLRDMLKANYTFRELNKQDTAILINYMLTKLKGEQK